MAPAQEADEAVSRRYSEEEIERGLVAAATLGLRPAEREIGVAESTIRGWIERHPERYAEIRAAEAPKWRARAAAAFEDVVEALTNVEWELVKKMRDSTDRLEPKDVGNALKSTSLSKAINADKATLLRGLPGQVVEHRYDMQQVEAAMQAALQSVPADADEITDAEAVETPEQITTENP